MIETTRCSADLLTVLNRAVRVEQQHPDSSSLYGTIVVQRCSDGQVWYAIVVYVAQSGRIREAISVVQKSRKTALGRTDLLMVLHGAIAIEKQDPYPSTINPTVIVTGRTYGDVRQTVTVHVTKTADIGEEIIVV
ncbi:MAG: hypothetical protein MI923_29260 [Phycisphaerales bacterium]|nr:hypothetical protein [Phycisphaerales bacterium]